MDSISHKETRVYKEQQLDSVYKNKSVGPHSTQIGTTY